MVRATLVSAMPQFRLNINNRTYETEASTDASLLDVLRDKLGLTGTKYGCGEGQCGACTVLADGKPIRSCTTSLFEVAEQPIETIEGLALGDTLHPLQEAFLEASAFQCGFCTPGMIMAAKALLAESANPSPEQIREHLEGNICRCGSYPRIVEAVQSAARSVKNA